MRIRPQILPAKRKQRGFIINPYIFGAGGDPPLDYDPYFGYVVLLAHFDNDILNVIDGNTDGDNSGGYGYTVSPTQSKFGGYSVSAGGPCFPFDSDYNLDTGDLAVEVWIYPTTLPGAATVDVFLDFRAPYTNTANKPILWINEYGNIELYTDPAVVISGGSVVLNAWNYVCWSRISGVSRLYLGQSGTAAQVGSSYTDSHSYTNGAVIVHMDAYGSSPLVGYVDELRITKGNGRGFSGPTIPVPTTAFPDEGLPVLTDPYFGDVRFLTHFTESATSIDPASVIPTGDPGKWQGLGGAVAEMATPSTVLFSPTSYYFNSGAGVVGSRIGKGSTITQALSTIDWVYEVWFYPTGVSAKQHIFDMVGYLADYTQIGPLIYIESSQITYWSQSARITGGTVVANAWNYAAYARDSATGTGYLYLGQEGSPTAALVGSWADTTNYPARQMNLSTSDYFGNRKFDGYIGETRLTLNRTRGYTGSTIPVPIEPFPDEGVSPADPYIANVALLMDFDGVANGSTSFVNRGNAAPSLFTRTSGGAATVSTSSPLTGSGSFNTNGTGGIYKGLNDWDYDFQMSSPGYTLEVSAVTTSPSSTMSLVDNRRDPPYGDGNVLYAIGGEFRYYDSGHGGDVLSGGVVLNGVKQHIAVTFTATPTNMMYLFVDGVVVDTFASGPGVGNNTNLFIGCYNNGANPWIGMIDEIRITKNVCRYTTNYTPQTTPFANY